MFVAALMSLSCGARQEGHVQCRVPRLSSASMCPQTEQVFDDGYHLSITIRLRPYQAHLRLGAR